MGIGFRIKEARERLGLTQTELGNLVGVTGSAITNYEKETSHPKEQVIYKLMEQLNVDANYLFQDAVKLPKERDEISLAEHEIIKKYRSLDTLGRETVNTVLDCEFERVNTINNLQEAAKRIKSYSNELLAAHARTDIKVTAEDIQHDLDLMDDDGWEE